MSLNSLGLGVVFTASDLASRVIRSLAGNFLGLNSTAGAAIEGLAQKVGISSSAMTTSLRGVVKGLAVAGVGFLGLSKSFKLASQAGEFEQGLAAVGAVTRATKEELKLLEQAAIQAGIATQFSPDEAVKGLTSLATAGQSATESTQTLIPVLDLAAGSLGKLGVEGAAEAVVGTLNAYKLGADQAASVTDRLLRITQLTNFQTRDFSAGLAKAAASGAVFNQSLDDTLIAMGLLRNRNIDASSSATALREATRRLGADQRAQAAITEVGVSVFDQQTGRMRSLLDIMSDFQRATKDLTDSEKSRRIAVAFGARGLLAFNAVANATAKTTINGNQVTLQGAEAIEQLRKEMKKAEGTAASFRSTLQDTFAGQVRQFKGTVQTLGITIGQQFAKLLTPVVRGVTAAINKLVQVINSLPAPVKKFIATFALVGSAVLVVGGLIFVFTKLLPILKLVRLGMLGITAPFSKVFLLMGLLAVAISAIAKSWEDAGLKEAVMPLFEAFKEGFGAVMEILKPVFRVIMDLGRIIGRIIGRVARILGRILVPAFKLVGAVIKALEPVAVPVFKAIEVVLKVVLSLAEALVVAIEKVSGLFEGLGRVLKGDFSTQTVEISDELAARVRKELAAGKTPLEVFESLNTGTGDTGKKTRSTSTRTTTSAVRKSTITRPTPLPAQTSGRRLSRQEVRALFEEGIRAGVISQQSRPIDVQGTVNLDGNRLGKMRMRRERDERARLGRLHSPLSGF